MSFQPCIWLQAHPDFSIFWFPIGATRCLLIEMRFTCQKLNVFDLTIDRRFIFNEDYPIFFNEQDIDILLRAVIQAIELYTGKYPDRSIRCVPGDQVQTNIFRVLLRANHDILSAVFSIEEEENNGFQALRRKPDIPTFLLKRKPDALRKTYPIQHTLNTHSQLFGNPVYVRLTEQVA